MLVLELFCEEMCVFETDESAYDYAFKYLIQQGFDPFNQLDVALFEQLRETYENDNIAGFYVDDLFRCVPAKYYG